MLSQLFLTFSRIGLLSIGGGYAIIPLIHEQVVQSKGWLSEKTFADIITISQMTPGPLAVNTSTFVGLQIGGLWGAITASVAAVAGGVMLALALQRFFETYRFSTYVQAILEGLKSSSLGLIVSAAATILLLAFYDNSTPAPSGWLSELNLTALGIFAVTLLLLRKWKVNPMLLMLASGLAGFVFYSF